MQKKSGQVALGGIATGMCIALMFATGMIPFSYYALPALAGLVLIAVREENGLSTALIVFAAVSLLSVFVVPIKEAALLFIAFFGYYPILQETFAKIRPKVLSWVVRLVIFNAAVVATGSSSMYLASPRFWRNSGTLVSTRCWCCWPLPMCFLSFTMAR